MQGTLKGYDQSTSLVLEACHERVYSAAAGVEQIVLGLYIIKGDNVYVRVAAPAMLAEVAARVR